MEEDCAKCHFASDLLFEWHLVQTLKIQNEVNDPARLTLLLTFNKFLVL